MEFEEVCLIKQSEKSQKSNQCTVRLVYEKSEGCFYIWKVLAGEHYIYQILSDCSHSCLPKLYDVTIADGATTVVEEYIEGQSLGRASISVKQFKSVVRDLCSVLEFLHGKGIIHRDIKPSNIIYKKDGHICLIDFDAARMPKDDLEQDTRLLGTRGYAPPEQYGFSQTDARADIYSLGVTLSQIMEGQIYRRRYRRVIKKCMNLNPDKRYQTIRQVRRAFFPAKRNVCCILVMLLLTHLFWNDIEIISKSMVEHAVSKVSDESSDSIIEIFFDGNPIYGYLGKPIEDIVAEKGEADSYYYISEESAGTYSYPGIEFQYDSYRGVYRILLNAIECTYSGQILNKDRDELIGLLGNPSSEGWIRQYDEYEKKTGTYYIEYLDFEGSIDVGFYLSTPNQPAYRVLVW